jgi:hypothetical protein
MGAQPSRTSTEQVAEMTMAKWLKRIDDIRRRYPSITPLATMNINMKVAMVSFLLESELTPETAPAWLDERITEFEAEAHALAPPPVQPPRRRGPRRKT